MDNILTMVRELVGSKRTCAGVFFTAAILHFGPKFIDIPALPQDWRWVPFVAMVLSGFFCMLWIASGIGRLVVALLNGFFRVTADDLAPLEMQLLKFAEHNDGILDLKLLWAHEDAPDRVESRLARESLLRWRLIGFSRTNKFYFLTKAGFEFVLRHRDKIRQS